MGRVGIHECGDVEVVCVRLLVGGGVVAAPVELSLDSGRQLRTRIFVGARLVAGARFSFGYRCWSVP